jgi:hypothetical protein
MAFLRYARANVVKPQLSYGAWDKIRVASGSKKLDRNLKAQAEQVLQEPFTPERFLLTHSTIVCSVDAEKVEGIVTGKVDFEGDSINRRYDDYRVSSATDIYINNNLDCWSREVLARSYQTFIGAHNFVEHVQVSELSKGRIIDAVLRDVGDSLYVDILVATDRKHEQLVADISSGKMNSMSMGCFKAGSLVTLSNGKRIPIEEIQPGEKVLTHKGNVKEVANKQMRRGTWGMRTIKVQGVPSPITATNNHPFFVVRPYDTCQCGCGQPLNASKHRDPSRRLSARYIKGHNLNVSNPANGEVELPSIDFNVVEVRADEIKKGDLVFFPRQKNTDNHVSNGKARLLGYFLAEGSFLKYKGEVSAVELNFSLNERDTFVNEVADLFLQEFGKEAKIYNREDRTTTSIRVYSKEVAQWFKQHGGEYSDKKELSDEVMSWSNENHLNLLGAFINGDGHLHRIHQHTSLTSCSEQLVYQLQTLLANNGIFSRLSKTTREGRKPAYTLIIGKIQAIALADFSAKVSSSNVHHNSSLRAFEDKILYKIDNIQEHSYEGWVYDLEVEDDHSYIVNGVAVHNCSVDFTICTKCGNVAADETEMCKHVKYEKGNIFFDEKGHKHRVAELCGHKSEGGTCGVTFIEASWVAVPAFKGAVARNTLEIPEIPGKEVIKKEDLNQIPAKWVEKEDAKAPSSLFNNPSLSVYLELMKHLPAEQLMKAASLKKALDFDFGGDEGGDEDKDKDKDKGDAKKGLLDDIEDQVISVIKERVKKKIQDEIEGNKNKEIAEEIEPEPKKEETDKKTDHLNDNIIKEGGLSRKQQKVATLYFKALKTAVEVGKTEKDKINNIKLVNSQFNIYIPSHIYRIASAVGKASSYSDLHTFMNVVDVYAKGNALSLTDKKNLIRLAKLLCIQKKS